MSSLAAALTALVLAAPKLYMCVSYGQQSITYMVHAYLSVANHFIEVVLRRLVCFSVGSWGKVYIA